MCGGPGSRTGKRCGTAPLTRARSTTERCCTGWSSTPYRTAEPLTARRRIAACDLLIGQCDAAVCAALGEDRAAVHRDRPDRAAAPAAPRMYSLSWKPGSGRPSFGAGLCGSAPVPALGKAPEGGLGALEAVAESVSP